MGKIFDRHVKFEFERQRLGGTIRTMTKELYVHNVPTLKGGRGRLGVYEFYKNSLVGKCPWAQRFYKCHERWERIRWLTS